MIPPGSVIYSTRATIGKVGINAIPIATNQGFTSFIPYENQIIPKFLGWVLIWATPQIEALCGSTTFKEISKGNLRQLEIPLPPLPEQHRIVEILDQAEALRQQRRQADVLSQKILPALFHEMLGSEVNSNKTTIGNICSFVSGGTPAKSEEAYWVGSIPWITPKDMKAINLSNSIDHVSQSAVTESRLKMLPAGTVLIVVRGMILAKTCPVAVTHVAATINQDMKGLLPNEGIEPQFLCWSLLTRQQELQTLVKTAGHGTKRFETEALKNLPVRVPSLERQMAFREAADNQTTRHFHQTSSAATLETLFQTLLHRAFDGSLTAKWREGHAKELLQEMENQARA